MCALLKYHTATPSSSFPQSGLQTIRLMEVGLPRTTVNMNDHSFTAGNDPNIVHIWFINSGGFGEFHEVSVLLPPVFHR
jgi:hypothetical protein